ncbi:MAG: right-handed parallel beta-helix repeat-containing protein [Deltaproteobacteria bacterium]|nr:right-handed parallel beta-helix repeat-containing protein [Deltaproteobacteria bacterium]
MKNVFLRGFLVLCALSFCSLAEANTCNVAYPKDFLPAFESLSKGTCSELSFTGSMEIFLEKPLLLNQFGPPISIVAPQGKTVRFIGWRGENKTAGLTIKRDNVLLQNVIFSDFPGNALELSGNNIQIVESEISRSGLSGIVITDNQDALACNALSFQNLARNILLRDNHIHHNGDFGVWVEGYQVSIQSSSPNRSQIHDNTRAGIFLKGESAYYRCKKEDAPFDPLKFLHTLFLSKVAIFNNGPTENRMGVQTEEPVFPRPTEVMAILNAGGDVTVSGHIPLSADSKNPWSLGRIDPVNLQVEIYAGLPGDGAQGRTFVGVAEKISLSGDFQTVIVKKDLPEGKEILFTALAEDVVLKVSSGFSLPAKALPAKLGDKVSAEDDNIPEKIEEPTEPTSADLDTDGDGISDAEEINHWHTDPKSCDTDKDGESDSIELGRIHPDAPTPECRGLQKAGTNFHDIHLLNPLEADSDHDGIPDGGEDANHNGWLDFNETDPTNPDTDSDGLNDGLEKNLVNDSFGLGGVDISHLSNGERCSPPTDKLDVDCDGVINARDEDSDTDGCLDSEEGIKDTNSDGIPDVWQADVKTCGQPSKVSSSSPSAPLGGGSNKPTPSEVAPQKSNAGAEALSAKGGGFCQLRVTAEKNIFPFLVYLVFFSSMWMVRRSVPRR